MMGAMKPCKRNPGESVSWKCFFFFFSLSLCHCSVLPAVSVSVRLLLESHQENSSDSLLDGVTVNSGKVW